MFSLIITIISIALVAALALATIYYGGSAFNRGSADAKASQLINEGQQINGAFAMAKADAQANGTTAPSTLAALVTNNYMSQTPANWAVGTDTLAGAVVREVSAEVCASIVAKGGATAVADGVYGCVTAGDPAVRTAFYKF